jgi:DNA ligase (NAD+)
MTEVYTDPLDIDKLSVKELEILIKKANEAYFGEEELIMSDAIYDMYIDFLRLKSKNNKLLKQVGSQVKDPKAKFKLDYKLYSMDKKKEKKLIMKWLDKYDPDYIVTDKLDGISGLIVYKNDGNIIFNTRGTATHGLNITKLLKYLPNIPDYEKVSKYCKKNKIKGEQNLIAFRGEILISKKIFKKNWKDKKANTRNTVGGLVNSKYVDPNLAVDSSFVVYELVDPNFDIMKQLKVIKDIGFEKVYHKKFKNLDYDILSKHLKKRRIDSIYDIDGVIVTNNKRHKRDNTGNPKYAFAFKVVLDDQKAMTKIVDIEWHISKDGYISPIVLIEPVSIGGVKIGRVSAFNAKYVVDNKLGVGAEIEVIRSGDVIPKIEKVIKKAKKVKLPDGDWHWNETKINIICDDCNNKEVITRQIYYFFDKLNVKGLGMKNVEKLYDSGLNTILKILNAKYKDILKMDGFKEKSSKKLHNALQNSLNDVELELIMGASNKFGRCIGVRKSKTVLDVYPNILKDYKKWKTEEFIEKIKGISGWDSKTSTEFVDKFDDFIKFYKSIEKFVKLKKKTKTVKNGKMSGKNIVMTGFRDKELSEKIVNNGGNVSNSISKNTDYLIVKDKESKKSKSSKIVKANNLGVKILIKSEIENMLD